MTDTKRLIELAGLAEYTLDSELFIKMDRVAGDALSAFNSRNNTDSLETVVNYYAMKHGVDEEQLLATVSGYLKNPGSLMTKETDGESELNRIRELSGMSPINEYPDETITFSVNNEKGYNAIMDRFNDLISWDGEYMVASEIVFARIEDLFASMGIDGPSEVGSEDDHDGQPDERQEWGDYMGGDDWDHGQYDEGEVVDFPNKKAPPQEYRSPYADFSEEDAQTWANSIINDLEKGLPEGYDNVEEWFDDLFGGGLPYDDSGRSQMMIIKIMLAHPAMEKINSVLKNKYNYDLAKMLFDSFNEMSQQAVVGEELNLEKMYEEYQEQLAFEDFEQAMQEAVTFAGGTPPEEREKAERGRLAQRFAPGAADIAGQVTNQPTEPHAKTVIGDNEPWEYTGDLGSSLGLKQKIDPEDYANVVSRDFRKWVRGSDLKSNKTRTVYDKMNNKQIKSTVWHPKARHEDIVAFEILAGSGGSFAPGTYIRKDSAPPEMIQRGRESGR